jgi:hypothetical protein
MHNGYFYPQDIKIVVKDGKRFGYVDLALPTKWSEDSLKVAKTDYLSGWEMARRAYEDEKTDKWMKEVYPLYHKEKIAAKNAYAEGMSVSAFRVFCKRC